MRWFAWLATFAALLSVSSALHSNVHVLFSGGGIRAEFGAMIAACELLAVHDEGNVKINFSKFVGLSGGAWGALMLANHRLHGVDNPCDEVRRVIELETWGNFETMSPLTCTGTNANNNCYLGWREGIRTLFPVSDRRPLKSIGSAFGKHTEHVALFGACRWEDHRSYHHGLCTSSISEEEIECANFNQGRLVGAENARRYRFGFEGTRVFQDKVMDDVHPEDLERENPLGFGDSLTGLDILAFSSAAWAEATSVSGAARTIRKSSMRAAIVEFEPDASFHENPGKVRRGSAVQSFSVVPGKVGNSVTRNVEAEKERVEFYFAMSNLAETQSSVKRRRRRDSALRPPRSLLATASGPNDQFEMKIIDDEEDSAGEDFTDTLSVQAQRDVTENHLDDFDAPDNMPPELMRGCDPGALCNLPLGYLALEKDVASIDSVLAFDYSMFESSDKAGSKTALLQCAMFWRGAYGWRVSRLRRQPFGYSFLLRLKDGDDFGQEADDDMDTVPDPSSFVAVHVITFQGITTGEKLVELFPTTVKKVFPNYFGYADGKTRGKVARQIVSEYAPWLYRVLHETSVLQFVRGLTLDHFDRMFPETQEVLHDAPKQSVVLAEAAGRSREPGQESGDDWDLQEIESLEDEDPMEAALEFSRHKGSDYFGGWDELPPQAVESAQAPPVGNINDNSDDPERKWLTSRKASELIRESLEAEGLEAEGFEGGFVEKGGVRHPRVRLSEIRRARTRPSALRFVQH